MNRAVRVIGTLLLLWSCLVWAGPIGHAEESFRILDSHVESQFGNEIIFYLQAESGSAIDRIALYRQLDGEVVTERTELVFAPSTSVDTSFLWELEAGELKPSTIITYYWLIENSAGQSVMTAPATLTYQDDRFTWQVLAQDDIELHYYGGSSTRAADILAAATEAAARLQADTGIDLDRTVHIHVYNSSQDMAATLSSRSEVYDARTVTLGVAMGNDTLLILGSHEDALSTVAHEMSHIIVGLATENPYTDMPRWLDEGLAMYAEGALPSDNARALDQAVKRDDLISVQSLSGYVGDPNQVDLFYGQAYSVIDFMIETYGSAKLQELLKTLQQGIPIEEAMGQVYGFGVAELDTAWRASLGLSPRQDPGQAAETNPDDNATPFCGAPAALGLILVGAAVWVSRQHA